MWDLHKRCRKCKIDKNISEFQKMDIWKYWVWSTCFRCITEKTKTYVPIKRCQKPIKLVSKTNKNNIASFIPKTKKEILERDKVCIISWDPIEEYHHVFYWPIQANYWPNRNNADQWVWLSAEIHRIIHHPSPKTAQLSKLYRLRCIIYVKEL